MSAILDRLHNNLCADLDSVLSNFKTAAKVTLVVRQPEVKGDAGIVIGNDEEPEKVIAEIRRRFAAQPCECHPDEDERGRSLHAPFCPARGGA